jgi:hypothetical protein
VGSHLLKLQRLQNSSHHWSFTKGHTDPTRDLHVAFEIPYKYNFVTKLRRQQAEVIQNRENVNVRNIDQTEAQHRK